MIVQAWIEIALQVDWNWVTVGGGRWVMGDG